MIYDQNLALLLLIKINKILFLNVKDKFANLRILTKRKFIKMKFFLLNN